MLKRIIGWSVRNRFLVALFTVAAMVAGVIAVRATPLEALPDLSDVQVIVQTEYSEQAPRIVEDPLASAKAVRLRNGILRGSTGR